MKKPLLFINCLFVSICGIAQDMGKNYETSKLDTVMADLDTSQLTSGESRAQ